ncbi:MAG: DUF2066 domain-containing protein [Filomicrobium sp.]
MTLRSEIAARPLFCLTLAAMAACFVTANPLTMRNASAAQSDAAYTIANYPVDARAKNAVAAKKAAIADGQTAALRSLLKRIVPVSAYPQLKSLGTIEASHYVDSLKVRREQNSSVEYYASLDFQFSPENVRTLLRQSGIPFVDNQAPLTTIIPVVLNADGNISRSKSPWGNVWKELDLKHSVSPLRVAGLRSSIHQDVLQGLAERDEARGLRILTSEYASQRVVLASAQVDPATNKLRVRIDGRDAVGPVAWENSYRIFDGDKAYAMELAAVISLGVLEGRWKRTTVQKSGGPGALAQPLQQLQIEVLFNSAREWYQVNDEISKISGVSGFQVGAVSARSANISLTFPGGGPGLANELARRGYVLNDNAGYWQIRPRF